MDAPIRKVFPLLPEDKEKLDADIRKYYAKEGASFIHQIWPWLKVNYIKKRANSIGCKLSKEAKYRMYREMALNNPAFLNSSKTAKQKRNREREKERYSPRRTPIKQPCEVEILALHKPWTPKTKVKNKKAEA